MFFFFDSLSAGGMIGNILALISGFFYAVVFLIKQIPEADFESYDTSIATVSADGTVKAKKAGEVRIAVSTIGGRAWMDITVKPLPTISKKTAILEVGDTVKLSMKQ